MEPLPVGVDSFRIVGGLPDGAVRIGSVRTNRVGEFAYSIDARCAPAARAKDGATVWVIDHTAGKEASSTISAHTCVTR